MMRRLVKGFLFASLFGVLLFDVTYAQEKVVDVDRLKTRVDSLKAAKAELENQLDQIETALDEAGAMLQLHMSEEIETGSVVLLTNMEASLRSRPSPDGRVVRILPRQTPLVALDYNGAYWKVRYQGMEGWIMRLFVDEGNGADEMKQRLSANGRGEAASLDLGANKLVAERMGKRFLVTDFGIHPPNSAGGVSVYYAFEHLDSTRTVREVTFSITPYNEEGLKERGVNSGASTKRLRRFGPISVFDGEKQYQFENVWYNGDIRCAQIDRLDIVYTDGSRTSHRNDVVNVLSGAIQNDCTVTTADRMDAEPDGEE